MEHYQGQWHSRDGLKIFTQGWQPAVPPKAVICLVHGLGEHSSRYAHLGEYLTAAGFTLLTFDLRGHGQSEGQRGHSPAFRAFMEDIDCLLHEAENRYPGKPRFLYGHSMGGLLVLNYALRFIPDLVGVISTGAGIRTPLVEQTLKVAIARLAAPLLPTLSLSTGLNPEFICRDPEMVQAYTDDPLVHFQATLQMAKTTMEAIPWVLEHASEFHLPLLLMHGTGDTLAYPEGSQEFAGKVSCDCTIKLWEGLYHEIHNEPERQEIFAYLVEWLENKLEIYHQDTVK